MIDKNEFEEFLKPSFEKNPPLSVEDKDHYAYIRDLRIFMTKWKDKTYPKMVIDLELDTGEKRAFFVSRMDVRDMVENKGFPKDPNEWVNMKVKIEVKDAKLPSGWKKVATIARVEE